MNKHLMKLLPAVALAFGACWYAVADDQPAKADAPVIKWDKSPRIVAFQLNRLSNAQLQQLQLKPEPQFKPGYEAQLTRKGLDKKYRDQAVTALTQIDHSSAVLEILNAIGKVDKEDKSTPRELIGLLMAQKPADLAAQRDKIQSLATDSDSDLVKEAAYAALAVGDGKPDQAWQLASSKGNEKQLLAGIPLIKDGKLRAAFYPMVNPLVTTAKDPATKIAAIDAISSIPGHEEETFKELAGIITNDKGDVRNAAIRSIRRISTDKWPTDAVEPLANTIIKIVKETPASDRTSAQTAQAVQLGNDLSGEMEDAKGQAVRKQLRELAVPVVVIRTLREQMQYDLKYFVVQAGKPVEVILQNEDAMPHNLVITEPGAMQEIAVAAGQMPPPAEDATKAYIPDSPKVLASVSMVPPEESATMTFTAPTKPGEYDFVCTFPGHWVRMYGVMLVVPDLEAWEKNPTAPHDPLNHKQYDTQKNEANASMAGMDHSH